MNNYSIFSIYSKKIHNCSFISDNFDSEFKTITCYVNSDNYKYHVKDRVEIKNINLNYDYIGKYKNIYPSNTIIIRGKNYNMIPVNEKIFKGRNYDFELFTAMEGLLNIFNIHECNSDFLETVYVNITHELSDIFIAGLKLTFKGTIGGKPFTAVWPQDLSELYFTDLTSLNFPVLRHICEKIIIPKKNNLNILIENNFSFCLKCIQTESEYMVSKSESDKEAGFFNIKVSFDITDKITTSIYENSAIAVLAQNKDKTCSKEEI